MSRNFTYWVLSTDHRVIATFHSTLRSTLESMYYYDDISTFRRNVSKELKPVFENHKETRTTHAPRPSSFKDVFESWK